MTRLGWFRTVSGHTKRVGVLHYWIGRWRLRRGYCPLCYSSPPLETCPICQGSYGYGIHMTEGRRSRWRDRWDIMRIPTDRLPGSMREI